MSSFNTVRLYRHLLKTARYFPSVKKDGIVQDIRHEFRANKGLEDPDKLQQARKIAVEGLQHMEMYTKLDPRSQEWEVHLKGACVT